jgi:phosphatidylserine/phosphatidylglycerophosphate/cardiolipin synthase-like enzyme
VDPANAPAAAAARAQQKRRRLRRRVLGVVIIALWAAIGFYQTNKPLPAGLRVASSWTPVAAADLRLLIDTTSADPYGRAIVQQQIFDELLRIVAGAREFLVVDMFLFNPWRGAAPQTPSANNQPLRELSRELRDALLDARRRNPQLRVLVISDPVNDAYGGAPSADFALLRRAGIAVVITDLDPLRDSNPVYSVPWRVLVKWWAGGASDGLLPNPLDGGPDRVGFGAWARLLNFKANHRKVLLADDGAGNLVGVVGSLNAHDASSLHSNMALAVRGPALAPLLDSELAIARFSGWRGDFPMVNRQPPRPVAVALAGGRGTRPTANTAPVQLQVLTEGAIREALLERLGAARHGDDVAIGMFYLAERDAVRALLAAAARGANIRLLLDPNKDAFGREKNGIPARPLAAELNSASQGAIKIRWYRTKGEQFHTKVAMIRSGQRFWAMLGSANLTRRNLDDYNLEADLATEMAADAPLAGELTRWFDTLWFNRGPRGTEYTAELGAFVDTSQGSYWAYRLMEATGMSTF